MSIKSSSLPPLKGLMRPEWLDEDRFQIHMKLVDNKTPILAKFQIDKDKNFKKFTDRGLLSTRGKEILKPITFKNSKISRLRRKFEPEMRLPVIINDSHKLLKKKHLKNLSLDVSNNKTPLKNRHEILDPSLYLISGLPMFKFDNDIKFEKKLLMTDDRRNAIVSKSISPKVEKRYFNKSVTPVRRTIELRFIKSPVSSESSDYSDSFEYL